MDKDTARAISDFERLGIFASKLKDASADIEEREAKLKGADKKQKDAEAAAAAIDAQIVTKRKELAGLENSIRVVGERLIADKDKARADFDDFVAGIKAEERAINAAHKKRQEEHKATLDAFIAKENDATKKFNALVLSHEKWKKDHGLA